VTRNYITGTDGIATIPITLAFGDSVAKVNAYSEQFPFPQITFTFTQYVYSQIDSIRSSGGTVELFWEKNLNANFVNYSVERCLNFNFDQSTVVVGTVTDVNVLTFTDTTAPAGTSPYYRVRMNYASGFHFYTNIRQVTVLP
jgi:hypothetical protein